MRSLRGGHWTSLTRCRLQTYFGHTLAYSGVSLQPQHFQEKLALCRAQDAAALGDSKRLDSNSAASCCAEATFDDGVRTNSVRSPLVAGLYIVGTPIGNLEDITLRALRVLREADVILAEDTRHSRKLLSHYGVGTKLVSFHGHNERGKEEQVLRMLKSGLRVALVSDAESNCREGMPLVNDPGSGLVKAAAEQGLSIHPIPGPSAVLAALVASGLPTNSFLFCGFLPPKQGARLTAIKGICEVRATLVFFVPPHSLHRVLTDLEACLTGKRRCVVAREITKIHEEFFRGNLAEAVAEFSSREPKGEITLAVEGDDHSSETASEADIEQRLIKLLADGISPSEAARTVSTSLNCSRNSVYALAVKLQQSL